MTRGDEAAPSGTVTETDGAVDRAATSAEASLDLWQRWDTSTDVHPGDDGLLPVVDLHLHRYCPIPFLPDPEADEGDDETGPGIVRRPVDRPRPRVQFLSGWARMALRNTPTLVLATTLVLVVAAELSPTVNGVSVFFPSVTPTDVLVLVGVGVVWTALTALVVSTGLVERTDLLRAVVVYGILAMLVAGTVGSVALVLTAGDPSRLPPNIIFSSGYLLTIYLGGLLIYDGMLRAENLFENLHEKDVVNSPPEDQPASCDPSGWSFENCFRGGEEQTPYGQFRERLARMLRETLGNTSVPTSYVFALLFVLQFAVVWALTPGPSGPQNLDFWPTYAVNLAADFVLVVVAFQFLVLLNGFYELVTDQHAGRAEEGADEDDEPVPLLDYDPFHPDGRGGYRDFGRFASRVNVLLILGGLFLTYRLIVQGARVLPIAIQSNGELLWLASFGGPVVAYALASGAWLYYSFWELHRKMARERQLHYLERIRQQPVPLDSADEAAAYTDLRTAPPVWPIETAALASLVSGTVAPILVAIPNLLL